MQDTTAMAKLLGLPENIVGQSVNILGRLMVVKGFQPKRRKYPVTVEGSQGGRYKATVEQVLAGLQVGNMTPKPTVPFKTEMWAPARFSGWKPGMRTKFERKDGSTVTGTVTRVSRKTVTVASDGGSLWRVSPIFLKTV